MRGQEELNDTSIQPMSITGLGEISHKYDGFIVDLWGVVHNGERLLDGTIECLTELKATGKTVVFLSNAPRSSGVVIDQLTAFGLPRNLYAGVVTSGDATIEYLRNCSAKTYFHIGCPDKDSSLLVGIGMNPAEQITEADLIIASNFSEGKADLDDYLQDFDRAIFVDVPMICANPDLIVHRGDQIFHCAGTLAEEYQARGGTVIYFGKPYQPVYKYLLTKFQSQSWLAVGDALATDIKGANNCGLDSLLVTSGIHRGDTLNFKNMNIFPKYYTELFAW